MSLEWIITLVAAGGGAALLGLSVWQTSRPRKDSVRVRWIPWRFLILASGAVMFLAAVHLSTLSGLRPGA